MKNNKLLCIFVIFMITTCQMKTFGQVEHVSSAPMPDPITKTIVRHYQNDDVVSYVQTTRNGYFTLSDAQNYHKTATIDPRYVVNDLVIENEFAYFCGNNTVSSTGFIGYFNVQDFFNGINGYYILDNLPGATPTNIVTQLERMVLFKNMDGLHVAAIGTEMGPNPLSCIVDYLPWATAGNNYAVGAIPQNQYLRYDFLDITHTDSYVVISDLYEGVLPTLRVFDINNLFAASGLQNYCYLFCSLSDNMFFVHNDILIEHLSSDLVVTATYWKDLTQPYPYDGTNLRVIDIPTLLLPPYSGMLYSIGLHQPCTSGSWNLLDIKNDPTKRCLYVLQDADEPTSPSGTVSMINEINYSTFPPANPVKGVYSPYGQLHSLDLYNGTMNYIASGMDYATTADQLFFSRQSLRSGFCSKPVLHSYSGYSLSETKIENSPLDVNRATLAPLMLMPQKITDNTMEISCER